VATATNNWPMNFGSGFNSRLSSSQPSRVIAIAPKAMVASSSPRRSKPCWMGCAWFKTCAPVFSRIAPAASGSKMPVSTASPPASGTGWS